MKYQDVVLRRAMLVLALAAAACGFDPKVDVGRLVCVPGNEDSCPKGYTCAANQRCCQGQGGVCAGDAGGPALDGPVDLSAGDGARDDGPASIDQPGPVDVPPDASDEAADPVDTPAGLAEAGPDTRDVAQPPPCGALDDVMNCGRCGNACPGPSRGSGTATCVGGVCALVCTGGQSLCGDECVDRQSDGKHCGACAMACSTGLVCQGGACKAVCGSGQTVCGQSCVDLATSVDHCGACDRRCGGRCMTGRCVAIWGVSKWGQAVWGP